MILKLKVKKNKKKSIVAWIQKDNDFDDSLHQIFRFFKDKIRTVSYTHLTLPTTPYV